jgi:hypothetical protein
MSPSEPSSFHPSSLGYVKLITPTFQLLFISTSTVSKRLYKVLFMGATHFPSSGLVLILNSETLEVILNNAECEDFIES